jgi:hypothetical protein
MSPTRRHLLVSENAIAVLRAKQQKLIRAAAETETLPPSSTIERIARLEDQIFGLEHVRDLRAGERQAVEEA